MTVLAFGRSNENMCALNTPARFSFALANTNELAVKVAQELLG